MNVFMGYNPLATKQAKVTVWVCEQDGETPVAPSNPSEGDCFVVYATDEAVLSNTPTSAKSYSNGEWIDAEGGGGGDYPTFTQSGESWSCNMTYAEAKTYWTTYNLNTICPCQKVSISSSWVNMIVADDTMLPGLEDTFDFDDDVTEAVVVLSIEGQSTTFYVAYGNNGKLYNISGHK